MLFAVVLLLFVCIGPQAPARLLYEYYGQYHVTAVLYTCVTQQVLMIYFCKNLYNRLSLLGFFYVFLLYLGL